jgi:hypothetical protein
MNPFVSKLYNSVGIFYFPIPRSFYAFSIIDPTNNHTTSTADRTYSIIASKNYMYPIGLHSAAFL